MRLFEALATRLSARAIDHEDFDLALMAEGRMTAAGKTVTPDKALKLPAVLAAISLNSDTVASFPVHAFQSKGDARVKVDRQPAWLDPNEGQPNPETDRFTFFSRILTSRYTHGNAYILITAFDRMGFPEEFFVLDPDEIWPERRNGRVVYRTVTGETLERFSRDNPTGRIIHVKGFDTGGLRGMSPIRKEAIGLALAQDEYAARFFSNGAQAGGHLEIPNNPGPDKVKRLKSDWNEHHQGAANAHQVGVLAGGARWVSTTIPNDDAQFLESRRFSLAEIARMFKVPPHLIADMERSTSWGSGIGEQNQMWFTVGLLPEVIRLELAFSPTLRPGEYLRFNPAGLLRADVKSRFEAYKSAIEAGWMTGDEVRAREEEAPAGLDQFRIPLNQMDSEDADRKARIDAAKSLIQAGFEPDDVAAWLELPLDHTGTVPVTVYPLTSG